MKQFFKRLFSKRESKRVYEHPEFMKQTGFTTKQNENFDSVVIGLVQNLSPALLKTNSGAEVEGLFQIDSDGDSPEKYLRCWLLIEPPRAAMLRYEMLTKEAYTEAVNKSRRIQAELMQPNPQAN